MGRWEVEQGRRKLYLRVVRITRRAPAAGVCPYCGSEQVAKALLRRSLVRENGGYRRSGCAASMPSIGETMLILLFRRGRGCGRIGNHR